MGWSSTTNSHSSNARISSPRRVSGAVRTQPTRPSGGPWPRVRETLAAILGRCPPHRSLSMRMT